MGLRTAVSEEALLKVRLESGRTVEEELKALRALARLLDSQFEVMGVKFGADALVGLIPVAGDAVTLVTGGAALEDAGELDAFLRPKLEAASTVAIDGTRP